MNSVQLLHYRAYSIGSILFIVPGIVYLSALYTMIYSYTTMLFLRLSWSIHFYFYLAMVYKGSVDLIL